MRLRRVLLILAVLLFAGGANGQTATQRAEAADLFSKGEIAFSNHDYLGAAVAFEAAHKVAPHPSALFNAARARDLAGDLAGAANHYSSFLEAAPEGMRDRDVATEQLVKLRGLLGRVLVIGSAAIIDDHEVTVNKEHFVLAGTHAARRANQPEGPVKEIQVKRGEQVTVFFDEPLATRQEASARPTGELPPRPPKNPKEERLPIWIFAGAATTTAALGALTVWSGLETATARSAYDSNPSTVAWEEGKALRTRTNALLGATLAAAVLTTGVAIFTFGRVRNDVRVTLAPAGVTMERSW